MKFEPRPTVPTWMTVLATIVAVLFALFLGGLLLMWGGLNPITAYRRMWEIGFADRYSVSDTLVKATPLLITGLGIAIAFRMKLWNIGAEGQLLMGAWAAAGVATKWLAPETPQWLMILAMTAAGLTAGALWGAIPGILKAKLNVNEIISSLMLVYVASEWVKYFTVGPWSVGGFATAAKFPKTAWLPRLIDFRETFPQWQGMTAHFGFVYGLIAAVILFILFRYSKWGYELKLMGDNVKAAEYAGVSIGRHIIMTMMLSGALAGLAGMVEVSGVVHRLDLSVSPGYGFTAIIVAWLARLNPLAMVIVAYLFGGLLVGGDAIQPAGIPRLIQGIVMVCVISADLLTRYKVRFR